MIIDNKYKQQKKKKKEQEAGEHLSIETRAAYVIQERCVEWWLCWWYLNNKVANLLLLNGLDTVRNLDGDPIFGEIYEMMMKTIF